MSKKLDSVLSCDFFFGFDVFFKSQQVGKQCSSHLTNINNNNNLSTNYYPPPLSSSSCNQPKTSNYLRHHHLVAFAGRRLPARLPFAALVAIAFVRLVVVEAGIDRKRRRRPRFPEPRLLMVVAWRSRSRRQLRSRLRREKPRTDTARRPQRPPLSQR